MATSKTVTDFLKKNDIKYVDLRFTDPRGKLQHLTYHVNLLSDAAFKKGLVFDGSAIKGWDCAQKSDMILMPDPDTAMIDPFYAEPTMSLFCDVIDPETQKPYARCPRALAKRAEKYLASSKIGDFAYFGIETAFYVFDNILFKSRPHESMIKIDSYENPCYTSKDMPEGNNGHRPRAHDAYAPVNPVDSGHDLRSEILTILEQLGVRVEKHHHGLAPSQHNVGLAFATLTRCADQMQTLKYVVQNVANTYGKTATFMPKPVADEKGSGMHMHQSLWKNEKPLFAGKKYAGLSDQALYYLGGIIKHAKALNALTNPTTNSYKRLFGDTNAPTLMTYAERNRGAGCRVPLTQTEKGKRIEARFPDPAANPYLAYAALLMAGLDGIKNKIDPGEALEKDMDDLSEKELKKIPQASSCLSESLAMLEKDHAFLLEGGVFTKEMIDSYIELKRAEIARYQAAPHPVEFELYYSV